MLDLVIGITPKGEYKGKLYLASKGFGPSETLGTTDFSDAGLGVRSPPTAAGRDHRIVLRSSLCG